MDVIETPRPTISLENLDVIVRPWPNAKDIDYDKGYKYGFRIIKTEHVSWKWPWPEWIGIPDRTNVKEWTQLLEGWMMVVMNPNDKENVERYVEKLLPYL